MAVPGAPRRRQAKQGRFRQTQCSASAVVPTTCAGTEVRFARRRHLFVRESKNDVAPGHATAGAIASNMEA